MIFLKLVLGRGPYHQNYFNRLPPSCFLCRENHRVYECPKKATLQTFQAALDTDLYGALKFLSALKFLALDIEYTRQSQKVRKPKSRRRRIEQTLVWGPKVSICPTKESRGVKRVDRKRSHVCRTMGQS